MSALVVGSMAPDIAFLLPIGVMRQESHSLGGLFWYCLPIGLFCYLLFHRLMKQPLLHLLPPAAFVRLESHDRSDWAISWPRLMPVLISILVGAITHLVWDSFTHRGSWAVRNIAWLQVHLYTGGGFWIYLYTLLQWLCSLLGLGLLYYWTARWLRTGSAPAATRFSSLSFARRRMVVAALLLISISAGIAEAWPYVTPQLLISAQELLIHLLLGMVAGFGTALIGYSLLWQYWRWHHP